METEFEVVAKYDRKRNLMPTVVCCNCGLVSHEHLPTEEELDKYYSIQYRSDYHGEFVPSPHRVVRAWEVGQCLLQMLQRHLKPNAAVFEVGAGIGCTVKSFAKAGYSASGIEPGAGFCRYAIEEIGADVAMQRLADVPAEPLYDFVLLVHVIEHFGSPRASIAQIRKLLRPGGQLYVECPNVGAPHAAPAKLFHFAHVHNFTPQSVQMIVESNGFTLKEKMATNDQRVVRMLFEVSDTYELRLIPGSYEAALDGIFRYNTLTYHLRAEYLMNRWRRAAGFISNHVMPRKKLQTISGYAIGDSRDAA
ncbi:MAG: class I SAM-dependent methyltransferase [Planctomycetales bacterium]|nr:class I SAM-dependent methyltransferase [Planctomycetales bacterium]